MMYIIKAQKSIPAQDHVEKSKQIVSERHTFFACVNNKVHTWSFLASTGHYILSIIKRSVSCEIEETKIFLLTSI